MSFQGSLLKLLLLLGFLAEELVDLQVEEQVELVEEQVELVEELVELVEELAYLQVEVEEPVELA